MTVAHLRNRRMLRTSKCNSALCSRARIVQHKTYVTSDRVSGQLANTAKKPRCDLFSQSVNSLFVAFAYGLLNSHLDLVTVRFKLTRDRNAKDHTILKLQRLIASYHFSSLLDTRHDRHTTTRLGCVEAWKLTRWIESIYWNALCLEVFKGSWNIQN